MKIYVIVPMITHYRETFYEKLILANSQHDFLIIDGVKDVDDGRPIYEKQFSFKYKRFKVTTKSVGPFTLRDYVGLVSFIKDNKPDLIICQAISGTKAFRQIGNLYRNNAFKLVLWSCLWEHPNVKKSFLKVLKYMVMKRYLNSANYHLTYSSYAKKRLIQYGFPAEKIHIAYNGLELDDLEQLQFGPDEIIDFKKQIGIEGDSKLFLYVGGLGPDKNVSLLLEAFEKLVGTYDKVKLKLLIIGDGPEKNSLVNYVNKRNLTESVIFLGRIINEVNAYFQVADCFVLPGAGGLGLNQAMYWGKPCIVSHADGTEEDLIHNNITGFKFTEGSVNSLVDAFYRFLECPDTELKLMKERARNLIINQSNVNKMVETFSKVIKLIEDEL